MRFTRLTEAAYKRFANRQDRIFFTQIPAYIKTRRDEGFQVELVGVVDGDPERIVCAAAVLYQPWMRFFRRARIAFGPTFEQFSEEAQRVFYEGLLTMLKRDRRVISVRTAPAVIRRDYDDITPGEETAEAQSFDRLMGGIGGKRVPLDFYDSSDIQIRFAYVKDLDGMDLKAATKSTGQQVRTAFNRYGTNGVEVRMVTPDEMDILEKVLAHTAERTEMNAVTDSTMAYYKALAKNLGPENAFLPVAVLNCPAYLEEISKEREEIEPKIAEFKDRQSVMEAEGKVLPKKQRNQLGELESRLEVLGRREAETREVQAKHGDEVVLAASFFIRSAGELVYLVSGAYSEFQSYYGIYLIHRVMFEWAVNNGVRYYNFFGMTGDFSDEASDAGVVHFKRQFKGDTEEYVGTYDLPVRPKLAGLLKANA